MWFSVGDVRLSMDELRNDGRSKSWNQFDVNMKKFGVVANFAEDMYTTPLNKTKRSP